MAANLRQKMVTIRAERDAAVEKADKLERRLHDEQQRAAESERELGQLEQQIGILEEDLEEAESRSKDIQMRAQRAEAEAEELEHRARRTSTLSGNDARRLSAITAKYNVAIKRAEESAELAKHLEGQVQQLEDDLVMAEERENEARRLNSEYEAELRQITENARSLGTHGTKAKDRGEMLAERIEKLERKLAEEEVRAERVTARESELEARLDEAEEEVEHWKREYSRIKEEYETTMVELGEM